MSKRSLLFSAFLLASSHLFSGYEYQYHQPGMRDRYPSFTYSPKKKAQAEPCEEEQEDKKVEAKNQIRNKKVILNEVKAVIITSENPPEYVRSMASDTELHRVLQDLPDKERKKLKKKVNRIIKGKTLTFDRLDQVRRTVSNFYREHGQALVVVTVPEQDVTDGVVVILVTEARLGEITLSGNRWFSDDHYLEYFRMQKDQVIKTSQVEEDLQMINWNPMRKATVVYKKGEAPGTTDIELDIKDERPFRFYAGADRSGFKVTEDERLFFGFNWFNVMDLDQILAFQYTVSPDFKKYQSVMGSYTAPLPWRDLLVFFGGYSRIEVNHSFIPVNVHLGESWQISGRYLVPFVPRNTWKQEAQAGFDVKRTNNDLVVGETSISNTDAMIFQFMGSYQTSFLWNNSRIEGYGEGYVQPWSIGSAMSQSAYAQLRPDANPYYFYMKVGGQYDWKDPRTEFAVRVRARTQASSTALLPLEQMGFGGMNSLRGYPERVVNVDQGLILNFEAFSPSVSLGKAFMRLKDPKDWIKGVLFVDVGMGGLRKTVTTQPENYFLSSIGPGFRFAIEPWLQVRFDLGFRLTDMPFGAPTDAIYQPYFSLIGSY